MSEAVNDKAVNNKTVNDGTTNTYTKKERNYYLAGMTGQNILFNIIGVGLALYYTEALYVPPAIVAVLMLIARSWDAFNDFLMGVIVDRTRSKWGKCRPYLIVMPFIIFPITVLSFSATFNYHNNPLATVIFIYVTYILWSMLYTVGDIPLWGITALMTESEKDRTKLLSLARTYGSIGGAVTFLLFIPVVGLFKNTGETFIFSGPGASGAYGYFMAALLFALFGCALFQLIGKNVKERIQPTYKKISVIDNFKLLGKNKPFIQIMLSGILGSPRQMLAVCSGYLILWYYANGDETRTIFYYAAIGGGFFISNLLAMYFTPVLLRSISKKNLYNWANLLSAIPFLLTFVLYLLNMDSLFSVAAMITLAGALIGFPTVLQSSMIADSVDYLEWKEGERADGLCFAGQTFIVKLQTAVAFYGALMILGYAGYDAKAMQLYVAEGGIARLQFPEVMTAMFAIITVLPAIGSLLAVIPTWKYSLSEATHQQILSELNTKRRLSEAEPALLKTQA